MKRAFAGAAILFISTLNLAAAPQLRLSSNTVGPVYIENGANASPQTVNAFNLGDGSLNLAITSVSASWLSASLGSATNCASGPVSACIPINITFNTASLAIGSYSETVTVADPNAIDAPQAITVILQVNGPPTSVDFYVTPNTGAATAQSATTFLTVNTGGAVLSSVRTNDGGGWLNFVLFGGNQILFTAYQVRVTAQTGQPEGNYSGVVILSGSMFPGDNKTINVNLHVTSQPILQIPSTPITFNLVQGQAPQTYNVTFQNLGLGGLTISGATTNAGDWLSALPARGSPTVAVTANPGSLTPGSYFGAITLLSNAANSAVPIPVRVNVAPPANPTIGYGGVVDNAAFASGQAVGAGSIAAIFGSQLSSSPPANASGFPLPTTLGGVQVLINGTAAPLIYVDANQVDLQIPFFLSTGQVMVQVMRNGQPGNRVTATVDALAPRLFAAAIFNSDGTLASPAHLAHPGDLLTIYALGLGPVAPAVNTGDAAPSREPLARITNPIQVTFGSGSFVATSTPVYAGLAPTFAGLYQINVLLPNISPTGTVPVFLTLPGHNSNTVQIPIAQQ